MNRDNIIALPNKHLRQRSQKISVFDDHLLKLINDMENATTDWENHRKHEIGVALAAPQVDVLKRVIIVRDNPEDKNNKNFTALINPVVVKKLGEPVQDFEGCLSVCDLYGKVPRYPKVKVKAHSVDGKEVRITAEGFLARVFQHEIDHLNGVLFVDHIKGNDAFFNLSESGELEKVNYDEIIKSDILWN